MRAKSDGVTIKLVPETLSRKQERIFLRNFEMSADANRPRVVLDCSNVRRPNKSFIRLLLCCLEEAMKRNGDVRLAALPSDAMLLLTEIGANRIFDIHPTTDDAVRSFRRPFLNEGLSYGPIPGGSLRETGERVPDSGVF